MIYSPCCQDKRDYSTTKTSFYILVMYLICDLLCICSDTKSICTGNVIHRVKSKCCEEILNFDICIFKIKYKCNSFVEPSELLPEIVDYFELTSYKKGRNSSSLLKRLIRFLKNIVKTN
jgi:hypothetical protein